METNKDEEVLLSQEAPKQIINKKRGRPAKVVAEPKADTKEEGKIVVKGKRGRPAKIPKEEVITEPKADTKMKKELEEMKKELEKIKREVKNDTEETEDIIKFTDTEISELSRINSEYSKEITLLKSLLLRDIKTPVPNKMFLEIIMYILKFTYDKHKINIKDISEVNSLPEKVVQTIYDGISKNSILDINTFSILGQLIRVSAYTEEKRIEIIENIIQGKEENNKIYKEFNFEDFLNKEGTLQLNQFLSSFFNSSIRKSLGKISNELYYNSEMKLERIQINPIYYNELKDNKYYAPLLRFKNPTVCYTKEDIYFISFYDKDTLDKISNTKINKKFFIREILHKNDPAFKE